MRPIVDIIDDVVKCNAHLSVLNGQLKLKSLSGSVPATLKSELKEHREEIIEFLNDWQQEAKTLVDRLPDIFPVNRDRILPLSFSQQRLWFIDQLGDGSVHYNIPFSLTLRGKLNASAFRETLSTIIDRHEVLRTTIEAPFGDPCQMIKSSFAVPLFETNLSMLSKSEQKKQLARLTSVNVNYSFNLALDLMIRATLVKLSDDEHIVLFNMHHIASEGGWSLGILIKEFAALYNAYSRGQPDPLPPLTLQYTDFACWQRKVFSGELRERHLDYWKGALENLPPVHNLTLDYERPMTESFRCTTHYQSIDKEMALTLRQLSASLDVTLFVFLETAFALLIGRRSGETDIVIGSPIAGRLQEELEPLIGFFINTLVLRTDLSGNPTFEDLLQSNKDTVLDAFDHQITPFEVLVEEINPERTLNYNPLFQIMFGLLNFEHEDLNLNGLTYEMNAEQSTSTQFDLELRVNESEEGLLLGWTYKESIFSATSIQRMAESFTVLIESIVDSPKTRITELDLLGIEERSTVLHAWNQTERKFSSDRKIHELIERQALLRPDSVAVSFRDSVLTYDGLKDRSDQLAAYLITRGAKPETLIALAMDRSAELIVSILGILKAGCAYVPLDHTYPVKRIRQVLDDSKPSFVITAGDLLEGEVFGASEVIDLSDPKTGPHIFTQSGTASKLKDLRLDSESLAYVIYTSGSTGVPKGVAVEHKSVVNKLEWIQGLLGIDSAERVLMKTPITFDVSVWEYFWPLSTGAQLVIAEPDKHKEPLYIRNLIQSVSVTMAHFVPSMLKTLLECGSLKNHSSLKRVFCSGEILPPETLEQFYSCCPKSTELHNLYGPTETTIHSSYWSCENYRKTSKVLIGKPISNTRFYVLDSNLKPTGIGVPGEICVAGEGLARGYLNRQELTDNYFTKNTSGVEGEVRLYRTGDLARWTPEGDLEFLGRIDNQVKLRGFRFELGEIEYFLTQLDEISAAVVQLQENEVGENILVAYIKGNPVVSQSRSTDGTEELQELCKDALSAQLPSYMVPDIYVRIEEIPVTVNGKLDRNALKKVDANVLASKDYQPPRNEDEQVICHLWEELLGVPQVGIKDNFFRLGGHSLLATKFVSAVRLHFNCELDLGAVFQNPTVIEIAEKLSSGGNGKVLPAIEKCSRNAKQPLSFSQQRLWFVDKLAGGSSHFNVPKVLRLNGDLNVAALEFSLEEIVRRHEILRTRIIEENGEPLQTIFSGKRKWTMEKSDLSALSRDEAEIQLENIIRQDARKSFNLENDFLLRTRLVRINSSEYVAVFNMHHIASDGWSMQILLREFVELHNCFVIGRSSTLMPIEVQYVDYAVWQRNWFTQEVRQSHLEYWTQQLDGASFLHTLALDKPRPSQQKFNGNFVGRTLGVKSTDRVNAFCAELDISLFMFLETVFALLIGKFSDETDVLVGSPISGRVHADTEPLIGLFLNTLVLRTRWQGNPMIEEIFLNNKATILEAFQYQHLPFEMLVEALNIDRNNNCNPIYQFMFILQNNEQQNMNLVGLETEFLEGKDFSSRHDIELSASELEFGLSFTWTYDCDLFLEESVSRLANSFVRLIGEIVEDRCKKLDDISLLSSEESDLLLRQWNETGCSYPINATVHGLFEKQVVVAPDRIAVSSKNLFLSYSQLDRRADFIASRLRDLGVLRNTLVGIYIERTLDTLVGILAILKAGGAYVLIDREYPAARIQTIVDDANLQFVISSEGVSHSAFSEEVVTVFLDQMYSGNEALLSSSKASELVCKQEGHDASDIACVLYTSGSTGTPKGVVLTHRGIVNRVCWMQSKFPLQETEIYAHKTSLSFVDHNPELFHPLMFGAQIHVIPKEIVMDGSRLVATLLSRNVHRIVLVPSLLKLMLQQSSITQLKALKLVMISGEALLWSVAYGFFKELPHSKLVNLWGSTEVGDASYFDVGKELKTYIGVGKEPLIELGNIQSHDEALIVPLGEAIDNMRMYVLDNSKKLSPLGAIGEAYVAGDGLARGYLNDPELTHDRFVSNPFSAQSSDKLYRQYDMVKWQPKGVLEFVGRRDFYVKIRGFRIELREIEVALRELDTVDDAVVVARENTKGTTAYLVAYLVASSTSGLSSAVDYSHAVSAFTMVCRKQLSMKLTDYMIPNMYIVIESIPLTISGKVDRAKLPDPTTKDIYREDYHAPRSTLEENLCHVWEEYFELDQIGIDENFFMLGGNSLKLLKLTDLMNTKCDIGEAEVSMQMFFDNPTIRGVSDMIVALSNFTASNLVNGGPSSSSEEAVEGEIA